MRRGVGARVGEHPSDDIPHSTVRGGYNRHGSSKRQDRARKVVAMCRRVDGWAWCVPEKRWDGKRR